MLATVASSTSANRIKRSLMASGINTIVVQTPAPLTKEGCGYSIRLRCRDVTAAAELLRRRQVPYRKVYLRGESGELEETAL